MICEQKVLAVITARAGSKGVKGKNFRLLGGRSLFSWSVKHAVESDFVDLVVISSNCKHVERITKNTLAPEYGDKVKFIQRPDELAGDASQNEDALIHAYEYCKEHFSFDAGWLVNLQPTSPFRTDGLLNKCFSRVIVYEADSLLTVNKVTPLTWKYTADPQGVPIPTPDYDVCNRPMRQDIPAGDWLYHDNGNVYITRSDVLLERRCRVGYSPILFETDEIQGLQIDTENDFLLAEAVVAKLYASV